MIHESKSMDELVFKVESFCNAFERIDDEILDKLSIFTSYSGEEHTVSVAATLANIRLYYFITQKHCDTSERRCGFEQLYYLLTNENSCWYSLTSNEKVNLIKKNPHILNHVIVINYEN